MSWFVTDWTLRCSFASESTWVNDHVPVAYEASCGVYPRDRSRVLELIKKKFMSARDSRFTGLAMVCGKKKLACKYYCLFEWVPAGYMRRKTPGRNTLAYAF